LANKDLIKQITQQVVNELENREQSSAGSAAKPAVPGDSAAASTQRVLVLLLTDAVELSEVEKQLKKLAERGVVIDLVLSESLDSDWRRRFKNLPAVDEIYEAGLPEQGCFSLVSRCEGVLIPSLSMDVLNQINSMEGDDLSGRLAVEALSQGKTVLVPEDGGVTMKNARIRDKYEQKLAEATNLGLQTAPLHELSYELLRETVDSGQLTEVNVSREKTADTGEPRVSIASGDEGCGAVLEAEGMRLSTTIGVRDVKQEVAGYIDHTLLNPDATRDEIVQLCKEAKEYGFASVCVNPAWVSLCNELLKGTDVRVCTVIGFPLGATTTATKVQETREAIANGADEIDMVLNIGALKEGDYDFVLRDIAAVKEATGNRVLKVIMETGMLSDSQKAEASRICKEAGADFVKTSTGFGPGGAKMNDIALMRRVVGEEMGVKASGGVHNFEEAIDMIAAGASRIGASAGVAIVSGETSDSDY